MSSTTEPVSTRVEPIGIDNASIATQAPAASMSSPAGLPPDPDDLDLLRTILFQQDRQRITEIQLALESLQQNIGDDEALINSITPIMGDIIRAKIQSSRAEMVEALYPIIGQLVVRAVSEAIHDLAQKVDTQMRSTLDIGNLWFHIRSRTVGVSTGEALIRRKLPFQITETFLIHRHSGLLLWYASHSAEPLQSDSDIVSGMLTAIRDFAGDTIGQGRDGDLDEIKYGDRRIFIESAQYVYIAVVFAGTEPAAFREFLRSQLFAFNQAHHKLLRNYSGDAAPLARAGRDLTRALAQFAKGKDGENRQGKRPRPTVDSMLDQVALTTIAFVSLLIIVLLTILIIYDFRGS